MKITNESIRYAEKILLPEGNFFDDERREFIKNFDTIDLEAVPGSGKTTALLAKLILLEKQMPLNGGRGVLVLSHTNIAVDEIKKRIGGIAPRLFEYPNFVGTIQSFVDHFLAVPCYSNMFGKRPYRIDNEIYDEKVMLYFENKASYPLKGWLNRSGGLRTLNSIRFDRNFDLIPAIGKKCSDFRLKDKNSRTYKTIKSMKVNILKNGVLHFDDAYFLAERYLHVYPKVKNFLQKRFQFVFIDEMQDMDRHQYDLLEELFYDVSGNVVYQRIGDVNQAIHSDISSDDAWSFRDDLLYLNNSHRLSPQIAQAVKYFGVNHIDVKGLNFNSSNKPIVIPYSDPTEVLPKFVKIIKEKGLDRLEVKLEHPFRAIGWASHQSVDSMGDKIRIQNYFPDFEKKQNNFCIDYQCLEDYLKFYEKSSNPLAPIRKNILRAFLKILRIEGKNYSMSEFLNIIKNEIGLYDNFKKDLYQWTLLVYRGEKLTDIIHGMEKFLLDNIDLFEINDLSQVTKAFLDGSSVLEESFLNKNNTNIFSKDGVNVKVSTVHAVKGETHTATLYMESFYYNNSGQSYESQRLESQFNMETITANSGVRVRESAKMVYVGFSRPTHLLCFAVHEDRLGEIQNSDIWEVYT